MDARELRIGNLIGRKYKSERLENECDVLDLKEMDNPKRIVEFYPIPLTEKWLLRFGFELDGDNEYIDDRMNLSLTHANELKTEWYDNNLCVYIKYVHHLQNLYHALTGKELTIKDCNL